MLPIKVTPKNYKHWLAFGFTSLKRQFKSIILDQKTWDQKLLSYVQENSVKNNPDSVLEAIDKFARAEHFLMNVGDKKGEILDRAILDAKATAILELGSYCGYSAIRIGRLLQQENSHLISLEKNPNYAAIATSLVKQAGLDNKVTIMVGEAKNIIPQLNQKFDLVFLDHWKDLYLSDLRLIEQHNLLKEKSVVVADNIGIFENSLKDYLDYVRHSGKYESTFYETTMEYNEAIEDGVEISILLPGKT